MPNIYSHTSGNRAQERRKKKATKIVEKKKEWGIEKFAEKKKQENIYFHPTKQKIHSFTLPALFILYFFYI